MNRRNFIALLGGAIGALNTLRAQAHLPKIVEKPPVEPTGKVDIRHGIYVHENCQDPGSDCLKIRVERWHHDELLASKSLLFTYHAIRNADSAKPHIQERIQDAIDALELIPAPVNG